MGIRSVHSRRTVPTHPSANAFARGACGGVLITLMPALANTASKAAVNFRIPIVQQEPQPGGALIEVHEKVPGLLGYPGAGWMRGHPDDVDLAGGGLEEEQHVDPLEEHGVDGEEVAGQDRVRLGGQKLFPGRPAAPWRRVAPGVVQDLPYRAGRHLVAQSGKFTLNAAVSP